MNEAVAAAQTDGNALSRSLRPRHVAMITIGGIIGAGLFVGSSVAITAAGPAIVITYALTGALVHGVHPGGARQLGRILGRLALLVLLGGRDPGRGDRRSRDYRALAAVAAVGGRTGADGAHDVGESHVGARLRRVRPPTAAT